MLVYGKNLEVILPWIVCAWK